MARNLLEGKVCLVTGATRGIGKGIALQLAKNGGKVYITGRTLDPVRDSQVGGSLTETSQEIKAFGGLCIPVQCDHTKDEEIEQLFDRISQENDGRLDILVNNAYSAVNAIFDQLSTSFWEQSTDMWDKVNNVGLRNHYICSVYAARLMVPRNSGLIVNISSAGGLRYIFNAAYGIGKEACDRMAADCGFELRKHNVAFVSLWPGGVGTETLLSKFKGGDDVVADYESVPPGLRKRSAMLEEISKGETTEFAGQCIVAIATDPEMIKMSGKIVQTYDLATRYGLKDSNGHAPVGVTALNDILRVLGYSWLARLVPNFVHLPKWIIALGGNKFF